LTEAVYHNVVDRAGQAHHSVPPVGDVPTMYTMEHRT
jgi:hypothetical protein